MHSFHFCNGHAPEVCILHTSANFEKSKAIFLKQIIFLKSLNSVFSVRQNSWIHKNECAYTFHVEPWDPVICMLVLPSKRHNLAPNHSPHRLDRSVRLAKLYLAQYGKFNFGRD